MIPVRLSNNRDAAQALFTQRWRNKPVITGLLRGYVGPFDDLETVVWDALEKTRTLDGNIGGVWLDWIGNIVGEKRAGRSDAAYTKSIKIRIRVNRSQGRASDLVDVLALWESPFTYTEFRFLSWQVDVPLDPFTPYLALLLTEAKASSSYGCIVGTLSSPGAEFCFSNGSDTTAGHVFDSAI